MFDPAALLAVLGGALRARAAIGKLEGAAAGSARRMAEAKRLLGQLEAGLGNHARALAAYEAAYRFHDSPRYLVRIAETARRIGDDRRAYHAYAELCAREGPGSAACEARDRFVRAGIE